MKTTGSLIQGTLRPDAYDPFAQYFRKFIEAYAAEGVPIYAVTVQNEPAFEPADYPGMRLDPAARAKFVGKHLGPLFAAHGDLNANPRLGSQLGRAQPAAHRCSPTARRADT